MLNSEKKSTYKLLAMALGILLGGFTLIGIDRNLQRVIEIRKLEPIQKPEGVDTVKVELGRLLFFDKILSGNKDIACATCHHPNLKSGDDLPLSIGVGGDGMGRSRLMGNYRNRIPRNSPEIFNRGDVKWHTMFWDGRVRDIHGMFETPADEKLPDGLENVLAAQAMFPVFSRDEMRGLNGDRDIDGNLNELALMSDARPQSIWMRLMQRILQFETYRELFAKVYPDIPFTELGFQHAANAIAAFESVAFTFEESPWDRYLKGEKEALGPSAKRGALLFYGRAHCAGCHSGRLMTDQQFHNLAVPQLGPGKDNGKPLDLGRYLETGDVKDRFAFRTPPLRNVATTGPWFHNGAYTSLQDVVMHHFQAEEQLRSYDGSQLEESLRTTFKGDESTINLLLENLDPALRQDIDLKENDMDDLIAFLNSLTDSTSLDLDYLVPEQVPSGLPVDQVQ
ncbi:cytochrome-c peroxidase [Marinoscillum sp.]|uniref:cytochrome-c peroxidase n=1 Tax=Marinoscillum sp. TaxID=2024838 RepID=UPI003BAAB300